MKGLLVIRHLIKEYIESKYKSVKGVLIWRLGLWDTIWLKRRNKSHSQNRKSRQNIISNRNSLSIMFVMICRLGSSIIRIIEMWWLVGSWTSRIKSLCFWIWKLEISILDIRINKENKLCFNGNAIILKEFIRSL